MKYRNKATGVIVDAMRLKSGYWLVTDDNSKYGWHGCDETFPQMYEPVTVIGSIGEPIRATGFYDGQIMGISLSGIAISPTGGIYPAGTAFPAMPTPPIESITNSYHDNDGNLLWSWTAKRVKDGCVLTNNLTGAIHELPKAAVEALMVLQACQPNTDRV